MQSVKLSGLEFLDENLNTLLKEIPKRSKELHERITNVLKSEVDIQIAKSGPEDSFGRAEDQQEPIDSSYFYDTAEKAVESKVIAEAEAYVEEIMQRLEG